MLKWLAMPITVPLYKVVLGDLAVLLIIIRFIKQFIEGWNS